MKKDEPQETNPKTGTRGTESWGKAIVMRVFCAILLAPVIVFIKNGFDITKVNEKEIASAAIDTFQNVGGFGPSKGHEVTHPAPVTPHAEFAPRPFTPKPRPLNWLGGSEHLR